MSGSIARDVSDFFMGSNTRRSNEVFGSRPNDMPRSGSRSTSGGRLPEPANASRGAINSVARASRRAASPKPIPNDILPDLAATARDVPRTVRDFRAARADDAAAAPLRAAPHEPGGQRRGAPDVLQAETTPACVAHI